MSTGELNGITSLKNATQPGNSSRVKYNAGMPGMYIGQVPIDEKRSNSVSNNPAYSSSLNMTSGATSSMPLHAGDHY